jgi:dienelactone hydrolase
MKYAFLFLLSLLVITGCAKKEESSMNTSSPIVTREVTYSSDGTTLKGFLAYDSTKAGKMPGVIVVHEWWGLDNYPRHRAEMLAKLGYVAFAIDMYGDGKTADNPKDAGDLAAASMKDMKEAQGRFDAGLDYLKQQPETDTSKIAAIGYCYGGSVVLQMALIGANLDGVVSFHGSLPTSKVSNPKDVKARILVCTGAADPFNPPKTVDAFEKSLKDAKVNYKLISYPDAKHSFTNPAADSLGKKFNMPIAYNKAADEQSWTAMQSFFDEIFK